MPSDLNQVRPPRNGRIIARAFRCRALTLRAAFVIALAWASTIASAQAARAELAAFDGHVSIGYSHLLISDSPGGSMSVAAGIGYPLNPELRVGGDVGFYLLGSQTIEEGSAVANVDYSMFEIVLFAHWRPSWAGPVSRISLGPTMASARAELSTSGGGLAFTEFAVEEIAPGVALDVTLLLGSPGAPVRAGFEIGGRYVLLDDDEDWKLATARLTVHY